MKLAYDFEDRTNQQRVTPFDVVDEVHPLTDRLAARLDFHSAEMPGPHFVDDAAAGHNAHALTHGRNALDRLVRRDLHRNVHVDAVRRELLLDQRARRRAGLAEHQRLPPQLRDRDRPMTRQRMAARHNEDDGIYEQQVPSELTMRDVGGDETDVGVERDNAFDDARRIPGEEFHRDTGVAAPKRDHEFRRVVAGGRDARRQVENSHTEVARLRKTLLGLVEDGEDAADILQKTATGRRQDQAPAHALEQCRGVLAFQPRNLTAHGGLGDAKAARGAAETPRLSDQGEGAELGQVPDHKRDIMTYQVNIGIA